MPSRTHDRVTDAIREGKTQQGIKNGSLPSIFVTQPLAEHAKQEERQEVGAADLWYTHNQRKQSLLALLLVFFLIHRQLEGSGLIDVCIFG